MVEHFASSELFPTCAIAYQSMWAPSACFCHTVDTTEPMQILLRHNHAAIRSLCWNLRRLHRTDPDGFSYFLYERIHLAVAVLANFHERLREENVERFADRVMGFPLANLRSRLVAHSHISYTACHMLWEAAFQDRRFHSQPGSSRLADRSKASLESCRFSPCVVRSPISPGRVQGWVRSFCRLALNRPCERIWRASYSMGRDCRLSVWNSCCAVWFVFGFCLSLSLHCFDILN